MQLPSNIIRHNFNPQSNFGHEARLIYNAAHTPAIGGSIAAVGEKLFSSAKFGKNIGKIALLPYRPLIWPTQLAWAAIKKGIKTTHTGFHIGKEAVSSVALTGVGTAALELAAAPVKNIKISTWDFPITLGKGAVNMASGILKSPLNFARGIRKSISTVITQPFVALKQVMQGDILKSMGTVRSAVYDTLTSPFVMPLKPILAAPLPAGEQLLRANVQYGHAYVNSFKHMRAGFNRLMNSWGTGSKNAEVARAEFFAKRKKAQEEAALLEGGGGKEKGKEG